MSKYFQAAYPFGASGGVLCMLAFLVMHWLGVEPINMTLIFGYIITPLFVFMGVKNFRDSFNQGELYFFQGMTVGFFVYTLMASISAGFIYLFLLANPEIFEAFRQINVALMEEKQSVFVEQLNQKAFDDTYENIRNMNIWDVAMNDFLRKIIPGLFFTIIISIILKRTFKS